MKDSECVLIEFINEDYKVAVGYLSWLQNETLRNKEALQKIIDGKEEVAINWPVNCEIAPASKMHKKVRNCSWKSHVVHILSFGEWTEMCKQCDNVLKFEIPNPSKSDRKVLKRKSLDNLETISADGDSIENGFKKSRTENKKTSKLRETAKKRAENNIVEALNIKKDKFQDDNTLTESSDDSSIDEQVSKHDISKTNLLHKQEVKKLKDEIFRLKKIIKYSEDIQQIDKCTKKVLSKLKEIEEKLKNLEKEIDKNTNNVMSWSTIETVPVYSNDIIKNKSEIMDTDPLIDCDSKNSPNDECLNADKEFSATINSDGITNTEYSGIIKNATIEFRPSHTSCENENIAFNENGLLKDSNKENKENSTLEKVVSGGRYFGFKHITNTQLSKVNDSSVSKLTCDLLSLVYEKTELRNSSLTGSIANANKSSNLDKKSTEKLDPVRLKAVENFIYEKFGKTDDNTKLFRNAVRSKCNNAKKKVPVKI
ncbi:uncharacterized protein [Temnothorax nylanderi]|uniref:uncharacterized protein n=1 Tax=Temnothorax nylanderi TaxID=102681 RepID=UPI003A8B3034